MIPYTDTLGRAYSRSGLDPAGPLSCLGIVLVLLARHGVKGGPQDAQKLPTWPTNSPLPGPLGQDGTLPQDRTGSRQIDAGGNGPVEPGTAHASASAATLEAERLLAAWAAGPDSPWAALPPTAADQPQEGDVLLLDTDGDPAGLAVVVCARQRLAVTSLPGRGVCALRLRALRGGLRQVYRWRGAA